MVDIHFGRPEPVDFELLLHEMCDPSFKNLTCSTIPLLWYWRDAARAAERIGEAIEAPLNRCRLCFEYPVKSLGSLKPSFTDLMCISDGVALAIEAKSTEPDYDTVSKWLSEGSPGRKDVLQHWIALIRDVAGSVDEQAIASLPYQLVHRTASACSIPAQRHLVMYEVFSLGVVRADYLDHLARMARAIPQGLEFWSHQVDLTPTDAYRTRTNEVAAARQQDRPMIVRRALIRDELFTIAADQIDKVA